MGRSAAAHKDNALVVGNLRLNPVRTVSQRQVLNHKADETHVLRFDEAIREDVKATNKRNGEKGENRQLLAVVTDLNTHVSYDYPVTNVTKKSLEDTYGEDYVGKTFAIHKQATGEGKGVRYATSVTEVEVAE